MRTVALITAVFSEVEAQMGAIPTHPEAHRWSSAVVTVGLWHARTGVGNRACSRLKMARRATPWPLTRRSRRGHGRPHRP
jgi:hypothetical protein